MGHDDLGTDRTAGRGGDHDRELAIVRGTRRHTGSRDLRRQTPLGDRDPDESTLGDRSDIMHRSRRGF